MSDPGNFNTIAFDKSKNLNIKITHMKQTQTDAYKTVNSINKKDQKILNAFQESVKRHRFLSDDVHSNFQVFNFENFDIKDKYFSEVKEDVNHSFHTMGNLTLEEEKGIYSKLYNISDNHSRKSTQIKSAAKFIEHDSLSEKELSDNSYELEVEYSKPSTIKEISYDNNENFSLASIIEDACNLKKKIQNEKLHNAAKVPRSSRILKQFMKK